MRSAAYVSMYHDGYCLLKMQLRLERLGGEEQTKKGGTSGRREERTSWGTSRHDAGDVTSRHNADPGKDPGNSDPGSWTVCPVGTYSGVKHDVNTSDECVVVVVKASLLTAQYKAL